MNIALVIDDPARLDFVIYELLKDTRELDNLFGMHAYQGDYKGSLVKVFFIGSNKDSVALRTEDLFLFEDLDLIVNVGYCYCWHDSKRVHDGDHVLVTAVKCDNDYRSLLNLNDFQNKKSLELDKRLEKRILDLSKKYVENLMPVSCYSVSNVFGAPPLPSGKITSPCFDKKAFALYEIALRHNRDMICLYAVRDPGFLDVQHYLLEKRQSDLDCLIRLALEFIFRCSC